MRSSSGGGGDCFCHTSLLFPLLAAAASRPSRGTLGGCLALLGGAAACTSPQLTCGGWLCCGCLGLGPRLSFPPLLLLLCLLLRVALACQLAQPLQCPLHAPLLLSDIQRPCSRTLLL